MAAKRKKSSTPLIIGVIILVIALVAGYKVLDPNTGNMPQGEFLYIHTGATYGDVKKELVRGGYISDMFSFDMLAKAAKYPAHVHAGKYKIDKGMSNYRIIRMLHAGRQTPVKMVINKIRTKDDLVRFISTQLEADSTALRKILNDSTVLSMYGLDSNTAMCVIVPDTYEFFWNTDAKSAFEKIAKNYSAFWTDARKQEATAKNFTVPQIITIASIVEEETNMATDKPLIASVYINRINKNIPLQADPTVKFAIGDFTIHRIIGPMLQVNSPYNTYLHAALPPGPICTPSKKTVDAVLQSPKTDYLYFCAREDLSGYSNFATNLADHMRNARAYQQALDARGIH